MAAPVWKIDPDSEVVFDPSYGDVNTSNSIPNGEFESNITGWEYDGDATQTTFARSTTWAAGGSASLHIVANSATAGQRTATGFSSTSLYMPVVAGKPYTLQAYGNLVSGSVTGSYLQIWIEWIDANNGVVSISSSTTASGTGVKFMRVSDVAPAGATKATVFLLHYAAGTAGKLDAYWDSVSFHELGSKLLTDGEFTDGVGDWGYEGTATQVTFARQTSWWANNPPGALRVTGTASSSQNTAVGRGSMPGWMPVVPGRKYAMAAVANIQTGSPRSSYAQIGINWLDGAGGFISGSSSVASSQGEGVKYLSVTATAPAGAASANLYLYHFANGTSGTLDTYWDSVWFGSSRELTLTSDPYFLTGEQLPMPDVDPLYASSVTTEGDRLQSLRYRNRKITLTMRVIGSSAQGLQTALNDLQAKVGKINRDAVLSGTGYGGVLQFTTVNGTVLKFDVCSASVQAEFGRPYVVRNGTDVTVEFECAPFARGTELDFGDNSSTDAMLVFAETGVPGDVPGLGRLVIDNDSSVDYLSAFWGVRSRNYSSASTAALVWQAENLTAMGAGAAVSSGTILANALTTAYQPILKSTVSSTYWTHVGAYRVYARVKGVGTGPVSVRASWALADIVNFTTNEAKSLVASGIYSLLDLGVVRIPQGTTRWELRLESASAVNGDDVYVDWIALVPIDEGFGVATVAATPAATLTAQDSFTQSSGPATQNLSQLGGSWTADGSVQGNFSMDTTNKRVQRTNTNDPTTYTLREGKFLYETATSAGQRAQVTLGWTNNDTYFYQGVVLRFTNISNFCVVVLNHDASEERSAYLEIYTAVSGTLKGLASTKFSLGSTSTTAATISATAYANGLVEGWCSTPNGGYATVSAVSSDLATGGTLATGHFGIYDWATSAGTVSRYYDDFYGWTLGTDAAIYASRSLSVQSNSVSRQDSGGTVWTRPSVYSGDYMLVPMAGKESRTVEVAVGRSRGRIDGIGDEGASDALSARLWVTPRYLQLPS